MKAGTESKSRLGRGLAALLGDTADELTLGEAGNGAREIAISHIAPNKRNPRRHFAPLELEELAVSIRQKGVIQPIIVRVLRNEPGFFEIIAGERRWRAAQLAKLDTIPALIIEANDAEALELAIIENVQRADLNPLEEAMGYDRLMQEYAYSQADMAGMIGKSRSHVANMLRLLKLPEYTRQLLAEGKISSGHARALLACENPDAIARQIVEKNLSVRDVEKLGRNFAASAKTGNASEDAGQGAQNADKARDKSIRKPSSLAQEVGNLSQAMAHELNAGMGLSSGHGSSPSTLQKLTASKTGKDANTVALEKSLSEALGIVVDIAHESAGGGLMTLSYATIDQLEMLCTRLISSD